MLKVGQEAPDFRVKTDRGEEVALRDFNGKNVLLYFFPKALTPG